MCLLATPLRRSGDIHTDQPVHAHGVPACVCWQPMCGTGGGRRRRSRVSRWIESSKKMSKRRHHVDPPLIFTLQKIDD